MARPVCFCGKSTYSSQYDRTALLSEAPVGATWPAFFIFYLTRPRYDLKMSAGDAFWEALQFNHDLVKQLKIIQPNFSWFVVPDNDPLVVSSMGGAPANFFILCRRAKMARQRFGTFAAIRCNGKNYVRAKDKSKWVRTVASKVVNQL